MEEVAEVHRNTLMVFLAKVNQHMCVTEPRLVRTRV